MRSRPPKKGEIWRDSMGNVTVQFLTFNQHRALNPPALIVGYLREPATLFQLGLRRFLRDFVPAKASVSARVPAETPGETE